MPRERFIDAWRKLRKGFRHAFATQPALPPPSVEETVLMERMADAIVQRGMAVPATLFLESMGPMNFLGSQALHFFAPIIDCAFDAREVERAAGLLERRDTVSRLILLIEARTSAR